MHKISIYSVQCRAKILVLCKHGISKQGVAFWKSTFEEESTFFNSLPWFGERESTTHSCFCWVLINLDIFFFSIKSTSHISAISLYGILNAFDTEILPAGWDLSKTYTQKVLCQILCNWYKNLKHNSKRTKMYEETDQERDHMLILKVD